MIIYDNDKNPVLSTGLSVIAAISEYINKKGDMSNWNLSSMNLSGIDFSECDLEYTNFSNSNLSKCNFTGAIMTYTNLSSVKLIGTTGNAREINNRVYGPYMAVWTDSVAAIGCKQLPIKVWSKIYMTGGLDTNFRDLDSLDFIDNYLDEAALDILGNIKEQM
jgi:hypothetical protein